VRGTWCAKWSLVTVVEASWGGDLVDKVGLGRHCRGLVGGYVVGNVGLGRHCRGLVRGMWSTKWALVVTVEVSWGVLDRQSGFWAPSSRPRGAHQVDKVGRGCHGRGLAEDTGSAKWPLGAVVEAS
jgi:hypothetical protein